MKRDLTALLMDFLRGIERWPWVLRLVLIGSVYIIFAEIGLLLGRPPVYASPVWPAAGAAVVGIILLGRATWPGLWLSVVIMDLLKLSNHGLAALTLDELTVACLIATGATLQALVGARVLEKACHTFRDQGARICWRMLLTASLLVTALSATFGTLAELWLGQLQAEYVVETWGVWWLGDCFGTLLFIPVLFALCSTLRNKKRETYAIVWLPFLVAATIVAGYYWLARWEQQDYKARVLQHGDLIKESLIDQLDQQEGVVSFLALFLSASAHVTSQEFKTVAERLMENQFVTWLGWAPLALADPRRSEETENNARTVAAAYPLRFINGEVTSGFTFGFDLFSVPAYRQAMSRALATGKPAQVSVQRGEPTQRLMLVPVYTRVKPGGGATALYPVGFVAGLLDSAVLRAPLLRQAGALGILAGLEQSLAGQSISVLSFAPADGHLQEQPSRITFDGHGGLQFTLLLSPTDHWQPGQSFLSRVYLATALVVQLLVTWLVLFYYGQHLRVRSLVSVRTEELSQAKERLQRVIEGSQLGYWDSDLTTGHVTYSGAWAAMLGYRLEDLEPTVDTWKSLIHPDDVEPTLAAFCEVIAGKRTHYSVEHRLRTASGEWRWIQTRGDVVSRDEKGKPLFASGIHADIQRRKEMESALRESEQRLLQINTNLEQIVGERTAAYNESEHFLRALLNALSASIAVVDAEGTIIATNESWQRFARENGADPERVGDGANYLAVCDAGGDQGRRMASIIRDVLSGRIAEGTFEYPCHSPTEKRWFHCRVTCFGEGEPRAVLAHQNITARKLAELESIAKAQELRATLKAIPDLLFDIDERGHIHQVWSSNREQLSFVERTFLGRNVTNISESNVMKQYTGIRVA